MDRLNQWDNNLPSILNARKNAEALFNDGELLSGCSLKTSAKVMIMDSPSSSPSINYLQGNERARHVQDVVKVGLVGLQALQVERREGEGKRILALPGPREEGEVLDVGVLGHQLPARQGGSWVEVLQAEFGQVGEAREGEVSYAMHWGDAHV